MEEHHLILASENNNNTSNNHMLLNADMCQSMTMCEIEDRQINNTANDESKNSSSSSSAVKSRSSRIINSIIRMSTLSSSNHNTTQINRSSTIDSITLPHHVSSYFPLNSNNSNSSTLNKADYKSQQNLVSKVRGEEDSMNMGFLVEEKVSEKKCDMIKEDQGGFLVEKWSGAQVQSWLEKSVDWLSNGQIRNGLRFVQSGKQLLQLTENDMEKVFLLTNQMHKRKVRLAIEELKSEKCKYPRMSDMSSEWVCAKWLREIGLVQYEIQFRQNLCDGRLLNSLQKKDLEKHFKVMKKTHQTSFMTAIEFLRRYNFDIKKIQDLRDIQARSHGHIDIQICTNEYFSDWLKLVNLQKYLPYLSQSGLHGALVMDSAFNVDFLFHCLDIKNDEFIQENNMRKILDEEIKILKKTKTGRPESSVFLRHIGSFRHEKKGSFNFRGSLGRALGKKIKREISSPLIDDDTLKRIEFKHKIVDMKEFAMNNSII